MFQSIDWSVYSVAFLTIIHNILFGDPSMLSANTFLLFFPPSDLISFCSIKYNNILRTILWLPAALLLNSVSFSINPNMLERFRYIFDAAINFYFFSPGFFFSVVFTISISFIKFKCETPQRFSDCRWCIQTQKVSNVLTFPFERFVVTWSGCVRNVFDKVFDEQWRARLAIQ